MKINGPKKEQLKNVFNLILKIIKKFIKNQLKKFLKSENKQLNKNWIKIMLIKRNKWINYILLQNYKIHKLKEKQRDKEKNIRLYWMDLNQSHKSPNLGVTLFKIL